MSGGFTESLFVQKLKGLKQSEDSIKTLCEWCLLYKKHADDIVNIWAREFKAASDNTQRISFYHWANETIQQSKRRGLPFPDKFARVLPDALRESYTTGDAAYQHRILRVLAIWYTRQMYSSSFFENIAAVLGFDVKILNKDLVEKKFRPSSAAAAPSRPPSVNIASSTPARDRLRGSDATPPLTPTDSPSVNHVPSLPSPAAPSPISSPVAASKAASNNGNAASSSSNATNNNNPAVAAQKASNDPVVKAVLELEQAAIEDQRVATKVVGILPDLKVMATLDQARAKRCMDVIVKHKWRLQQGVKRRKALIELLQTMLATNTMTVQKQTNDIAECTTQLNKLSAIAGVPVPVSGTATASSPSSASAGTVTTPNGKRKADGTLETKDIESPTNDKRAKVETAPAAVAVAVAPPAASAVPFTPPTDPRRRPAPPSPAASSAPPAAAITSPVQTTAPTATTNHEAAPMVAVAPLAVPVAVAPLAVSAPSPSVQPVSGDVLDGINGLLANGALLAALAPLAAVPPSS